MTVPGCLTTASRRRLLADAAVLAASLRSNMPGILAASVADPNRSGGIMMEPASLDEPLLAAASAFCNVERRMLALIEGPNCTDDVEVRDRVLEPLRDEQLPYLDALCRMEAQTLTGHAARALAFLLWDGGELAYQAEVRMFLDDRLLWLLVRDLAAVPC